MSIYNRHRPQLFKHMIGQKAAVLALSSTLKAADTMQCYLFSGPSGVGKTTLARIMAKKLKCQVQDVNGATFTGIDAMREVQNTAAYMPFGVDVEGRAIIVDECHRLSGNAWDSLLQATEEPPPGVYWFFCTTNPDKVPRTIQTRSLRLQLKPLSRNELDDLLQRASAEEGIQLDDGIRQLIVAESNGSARQALVYLDACRDARDRSEVVDLLKASRDSEPVLQLCRLVTNGGGDWASAMKCYHDLEDENPEGVRLQVVAYIAKALRNARNDRDAQFLLNKLECFAFSYGQSDGSAQLLRSIGACLYSH